MILDVSSFVNIIWTHVLSRIGHELSHTKIHELLRMAEAMRRMDTYIHIKNAASIDASIPLTTHKAVLLYL